MLNKRTFIGLCLLACALLLCSCAAPAPIAVDSPAKTVEIIEVASVITPTPAVEASTAQAAVPSFPVNEPTGEGTEIVVSTVDAFLAAIGSDRTIYLQPGEYDLTLAKDFGKSTTPPNYEWIEQYDGYQLWIHDVQNMAIVGHSASDVEIRTTPRYASVLGFADCSGISVDGITAGHTEGPGSCAGSVLYFESTNGVSVAHCDLYGCGTYGVEAYHCADVNVEGCTIRDCSLGAMRIVRGENVQARDCRMTACGSVENPALSMLQLMQSNDVAILDCTVENSVCLSLLDSNYCKDVQLLGCAVNNNTLTQAVFALAQYSPIVEGCAFTNNVGPGWYGDSLDSGKPVQAVSKAGKTLTGDDFANMQQAEVAYVAPEPAASVELNTTVTADGMREVRVSTIDEFLAAIASDTTVYLGEGTYDFNAAFDYGAMGTDTYYWEDVFDGPGLIITHVENFHIVGSGADKTFLNAMPRYADVLTFQHCKNVSVTGATLGHFKARGECTGGVLRFIGTASVTVRDCKLFGCGILGVDATECSDIVVDNTEIYDCSQGAVSLNSCNDVALANCNIHDCGEPTFSVNGCKRVTNDGKEIASTKY